jgi:hypothetical protein
VRYAHLKIQPTRVNEAFIGGPLLHFERITDDQLLELGGKCLPGLARGNSTYSDGIRARRLKDGTINVVVESTSSILRDPKFDLMMSSICAQPMPASTSYDAIIERTIEQLDAASRLPRVGTWSWDIDTDAIALCSSSFAMLGVPHDARWNLTMGGLVSKLAPDDMQRVTKAIAAALDDGAPYDVHFHWSESGALIRSTAAVIRDENGRPTKMVGALTVVMAETRGEFA